MNASWLPPLVLASTVFLTACAPPEPADAQRPVDVPAVSAGAPSAVNAGSASPSHASARPATSGPVRPVVEPVMVQRAELQPTERFGASAGPAFIPVPPGSLERRTTGEEVGAAARVSARGRGGVKPAVTAALTPPTALKVAEKGGSGAAELAAPLPLAVVASAQAQGFTPEQTRLLIQMGESFLAETAAASSLTPQSLNGGGVPFSPAEIWEASTWASDERFRAMFGYQAFNAMQLLRAREAYAEAKANAAAQ